MKASEYLECDAHDLAALVAGREITPIELRRAAFEVVGQRNGALNALTATFESDDPASPPDGAPFAGVPFLLKELVAQAGKPLTFGSRAFSDHIARETHPTAVWAESLGLQIVGRTTCSEFGLTPTCYSELFGQTRNPWSREHDPGGSSGGSAVAVAAGFVPMAQAGDAGGSIRIPAAACGVFGFMASRGQSPLPGANFDGLLRHGVITRSVRDAHAYFAATRRDQPGDRWTLGVLDPARGDRLRIALVGEAFCGVHVCAEHRAAAERVAGVCAELGHAVEMIDAGVAFEPALAAFERVISIGAARAMSQRPEAGESFEAWTRHLAQKGRALSALDIYAAFDALDRLAREIAAIHASYDVILHPTLMQPIWRAGEVQRAPLSETFDTITRTVGNSFFANVAGLPAMSIPLAMSADGLPIGIQFMGPRGSDLRLLALAAELERVLPWRDRRPPASAELDA